MKKEIILGFLLVMAGCTTPQSPEPGVPDMTPSCPKATFDRHLWQPAEILDSLSLPAGARVVYPNQAITMDYRPNRLNIAIGKLGRIERVWCG